MPRSQRLHLHSLLRTSVKSSAVVKVVKTNRLSVPHRRASLALVEQPANNFVLEKLEANWQALLEANWQAILRGFAVC
jgi:hypothetical protein